MQNHLSEGQYAFIKYLTGLNTDDDRGTLAVMRRGLSGIPVEDLNLYRFVAKKIPENDRGTNREGVYYLVAALYALHPSETTEGNFGSHMRLVAYQRDDQEAAERRFTVLLNTRIEDLAKPLRQAVTMVKQQELPVNWTGLFADLLHWDHPKKIAQRAWANSFWGYEGPVDDAKAKEPDNHQQQGD